jgi:hypothetical protein
MRTFILIFLGLLILVIGCTTDQSEEIAKLKLEVEELKSLANPPPGSLDSLYPPNAEAPIYLFKMFEMSTPLAGIAIDMFEEDLEHARTNFERFKTQYGDISKLVPEWENEYPMEPIDELGESFEAGEQGKVMAAFEKVGKVCHDCHITNMIKVQQKYHWGDFSELIVMDPLTKEDVKFNQFMWNLEMSIVGVSVDIEQGQVENALKHFETFNERFQELRETCYFCHETEREYFVDQKVQILMDKVGMTLKADSPDPKLIGKLLEGIGAESCFKCHLVHLPAAFTKIRWENLESIVSKE